MFTGSNDDARTFGNDSRTFDERGERERVPEMERERGRGL
jgi:hypothetical protein